MEEALKITIPEPVKEHDFDTDPRTFTEQFALALKGMGCLKPLVFPVEKLGLVKQLIRFANTTTRQRHYLIVRIGPSVGVLRCID